MKKLMQAIFVKTMSPRRYIALVLGVAVIAGVGFAALNYAVNDFGLWRHRDVARIWTLEKTSKYLLAQRYVPENFDGIMIGASVSANMDTRAIKGYRVYNLSMSGGNITETSAAATQYLNAPGDHKIIIVCLYPYLTKNSGFKSFQIDPKEYYGSVFSLIPVSVWASKVLGFLHLAAHDFDHSEAGWNNFTVSRRGDDMQAYTAELNAQLSRSDDALQKIEPQFGIDAQAVKELDALLKLARAKHVRVVAWYYPVFGPDFDLLRRTGEWGYYQRAMNDLFRPGEIVLDMNTKPFKALQYDPANYHDRMSHMVPEGAEKLISALNRVVKP